jgi:phosphoribosylglycinamide formyltransferase-1
VSGATVHFVDQAYDRGPLIAQWPVPVVRGDTASSLAARVLQVEHTLYPVVVNAVAAGRVTLAGDGTVRWSAVAPAEGAGARDDVDWAFCLTRGGPQLAAEIARAIGS